MKVTILSYNAVASWKWDTSSEPHEIHHFTETTNDSLAGEEDQAEDDDDDDDDDDDLCGICQAAFESCCPTCKVPGDDCPLSELCAIDQRVLYDNKPLYQVWGECSHVFHMHCLLKWIDMESSKQQCPLDRRPWATADRKPDKLPTTLTGAPVETIPPGPLPPNDLSLSSLPAIDFSRAPSAESGPQEGRALEGEGEDVNLDEGIMEVDGIGIAVR